MFVCFFSFVNFLRCWCLIHFMVETACTMQPITVILLVLRQFFVQLNQVEWLLLAMSFCFLSIIIIMIMILMHSFRLLVYDCILYWNDWLQGICSAFSWHQSFALSGSLSRSITLLPWKTCITILDHLIYIFSL